MFNYCINMLIFVNINLYLLGKYSCCNFGNHFQTRYLIHLLKLIAFAHLQKEYMCYWWQVQISYRQCLTSPGHRVVHMVISSLDEGQQLHLYLVLGCKSNWVVFIPKNASGMLQSKRDLAYLPPTVFSSKYQLFSKFEIQEQNNPDAWINTPTIFILTLLFFKNNELAHVSISA